MIQTLLSFTSLIATVEEKRQVTPQQNSEAGAWEGGKKPTLEAAEKIRSTFGQKVVGQLS